MSKVKFNIPSFMMGTLPTDGSQVKTDITLVGTDGVTVIVKQNAKTIYTEKPVKFFEADVGPGDRFAYQFIFPNNTLNNNTSTQFTTPSKSVYIFSDSDGLSREGKITKNVKGGTIEITPPSETEAAANSIAESVSAAGSAAAASAAGAVSETKKKGQVFVDNTVLLQNALLGNLEMLGFTQGSPFFSILMIVYKLVLDMIVVLIFWILFVSISCWLTIPSEYIYPTKVDQYPLLFLKKKKDPDIDHYFNITTHVDDLLCTPYAKDTIEKSRQIQEDYFSKLKDLPEEQKAILDAIYPAFLKMDEKSVPKFSSILQDKCHKTELCTMDYITYFSCSLVFYNYLYCNTMISYIHDGFYFIRNKVIKNLSPVITTVLFAALLYYMFMGVGLFNDKLMARFNIKLPEEGDFSSGIMNQFLMLLVSVLSCCLTIITPLAGIFVVTSLLTAAFMTAKSCLFPFNMTLLVIAFLTLFFSISQYIYIVKKFAEGMDPLEVLEKMYIKDLTIHSFLSFLGVTVPIIFAAGYATYIGSSIFFSFFQFMKHESIREMMKSTAASVVLVGLVLLFLSVNNTLGQAYGFMTFIIILLVGLYVYTKN